MEDEDLLYLEQLAKQYKTKGEQSGLWTDYLKAHGLANYCVAKDATEKRNRLVYDIENSWYKEEHPLSYDEHQTLIATHKNILQKYRASTKAVFDALTSKAILLDSDDVFFDQNIDCALQFSQDVFEAMTISTNGFLEVSNSIIKSSVETLGKVHKTAPCQFAVIGLGSLAKGEVTPFSDLEYAFIVEREAKEYFEMLAVDTYFNIGNLGESPLKGFDIQELKENKRLQSFVCDNTTVGYRIDGITEKAGNIPTGNGRRSSSKLTLTVKEFIKLYKKSAESPFDGIAGDKSDMLSSSVLIYTNEGDFSQLLEELNNAIEKYELTKGRKKGTKRKRRERRKRKRREKKRIQSFTEDVKRYKFLPEFVQFQPPKNMDIEVKPDIFRFPTLLANNIKMCISSTFSMSTDETNPSSNYPWTVYSNLYVQGFFTEKQLQYIKIVLALSIYLRTSAYINQESQAQLVSLSPYIAGLTKFRHEIPANVFITLGCFLAPIKKTLMSAVAMRTNVSSDQQLLVTTIKRINVDKKDNLTNAEVCYFAGEYQRAKKYLSKAIDAKVETITLRNFVAKIQQENTHKDIAKITRKYVELACYLLYYNQDYRSAIDYFQWMITNNIEEKQLWMLLMAHCRQEMGDLITCGDLLKTAMNIPITNEEDNRSVAHSDICLRCRNIGYAFQALGEYSEALEYYAKSLKMERSIHGADSIHPNIADTYNRIGVIYLELGEHTSALDYCSKSLEMKKAIYGANTNYPDIAGTYNNVGVAYYAIGEYTTALIFYSKSSEMQKAIYGMNTNHPDIANSYRNIGEVYDTLGEYASALDYYSKSSEMKKAIYGADTSHPNIASAFDNIGCTYQARGEHTSALDYYSKSLEMRKAIYGTDTNHPDIAASYHNIGGVYQALGEHTTALDYHCKSLEIRKAIYCTGTNHPAIAASYYNIGGVYQALGEYTTALDHYFKSLKMLKAIYGMNTNHRDIAHSDNSIGVVYQTLGEHTSALGYYSKSLVMRKAIYSMDTNHPDIAASYHNIGGVYHALGEHATALDYYCKSLEIRQAIYGTDTNHPDIAASYQNIGGVYQTLGEHTSALGCYSKSLEMRKAIYSTNCSYPKIADTYKNIGAVYQTIRESTAALNYSRRSRIHQNACKHIAVVATRFLS